MIVPVVAVVQRDNNEGLTVSLGGADETPSSRFGVAGLDADGAVIIPQQFVVIEKKARQLAVHGGGKLFLCGNDGLEGGILQGGSGNPRKLVGGGIVPLGGQSVRILKTGVLQSHARARLVHFFGKRRNVSRTGDGKRVCRVVARFQQQSV